MVVPLLMRPSDTAQEAHMASEFTYTRDDGHWIVDPVELERLNRGYWRDDLASPRGWG